MTATYFPFLRKFDYVENFLSCWCSPRLPLIYSSTGSDRFTVGDLDTSCKITSTIGRRTANQTVSLMLSNRTLYRTHSEQITRYVVISFVGAIIWLAQEGSTHQWTRTVFGIGSHGAIRVKRNRLAQVLTCKRIALGNTIAETTYTHVSRAGCIRRRYATLTAMDHTDDYGRYAAVD